MGIPGIDPTLFSLTSAQIDLAFGLTVLGISDLSRSQELKAEVEIGSDGLPIGAPRGTYSGTIDFTILLEEFGALVTALGDGYMQAVFPLNATYIEIGGSGVMTFDAPALRIVKDDWKEANDGKASRVAVSCMVLEPYLINGVAAVGSGGLVGSVSSIVSAVGSLF